MRLYNFIYLDSQTKLQLDLNVNRVIYEILFIAKVRKRKLTLWMAFAQMQMMNELIWSTINYVFIVSEMMHTFRPNFILLSSLKRDICWEKLMKVLECLVYHQNHSFPFKRFSCCLIFNNKTPIHQRKLISNSPWTHSIHHVFHYTLVGRRSDNTVFNSKLTIERIHSAQWIIVFDKFIRCKYERM